REALIVKRDYLFFSHNPLNAIESVAKAHPDENIKTVFLGYTSVLRSGGDLVVYLNSKVKDGLMFVVDKWRRYAESASTLGEISLSVFLMFPSLLIAMSVAFASGYSVLMMQLYGYLVLPLIGTFMIAGIHFSQPKFYDSYDVNRMVALAAGAAAAFGAFTFFFVQPVSYWLASTLLVFSVLVGAEYLREQSEVSKVEKALPSFLRDITEMMKIGYEISQALVNLSKQRQYNKVFDRLLKRVAEHLEMNMPLRSIAERMAVRSWLCRYTFFILSEIVDTGGGTPEVLENLTGFVNSVVLEKSKAKSTTRTYSFLGYATPAFLSSVMVFMANMLLPSLGNMSFGSTPISIMPSASSLAMISDTGMMVVVLTAFVIGMLIAKIVDMSVYATYHSAIALVICFISFTFIK
ncbi:MAG: type II secretion system F family protein, partial [Candidatus Verstraetearchaeota archaeon]|nr:type II secretion system F family protein [Candidatus Verstraetearchaeota archaeon]